MTVRSLLCLAVCLSWRAAPDAAAADRPNIVVILADDLGYSDLGCYGGEIQTPNLDALAAGGLRFTQFYNTARCWPSRSALMTGYYAQQIHRDELPGLPGGGRGVRPIWARLLPEFLAPLGYRSYHSGKWHIDGDVLAGGFHHSYLLNDHNRFFHPQQHLLDDQPLPPVPAGTDFYVTTAMADHAIDFLQEHRQQHADKPFLLYLCFTSPHFPIHARADDIAKYDGVYDVGWDVIRDRRAAKQRELGLLSAALSPLDGETIPAWNFAEVDLKAKVGDVEVCHAVPWQTLTPAQQTFQAQKMAAHAAMVDRMDQEIGRVLAQVRAMQADRNTVTMFLSDNGASAEQIIRGDGHDPAAPVGSAATFLGIGPGWSTAANTPFRLHKSWVHEGGICTPFIVNWPQGLPQRGEVRSNPAHLIDIVPTLLEMAGATKPETWEGHAIPPAPGRSLVPAIAKDGSVSHNDFWWYHSTNRAIRMGDWKLVSKGAEGPWELYDLSHDRTELTDLSTSNPAKAEELKAAWTRRMEEFRDLAAQDVPPVSPPGNAGQRRPNRRQPAAN